MEQSVATSSLTIYKFTKPKWADRLVRDGLARVGTLFDYQRDVYVSAISDPTEGRDPLFLPFTGPVPPPDQRPAIVRAIFPGEAEGVYLDRCAFTENRVSENCYVYSVSLMFSEQHLAEFGGACVRIRRFARFGKYLTEAVRARHPEGIKEGRFGGCTYRAKGGDFREYTEHDSKIHPVWIKPLDLDWQNEARLVWRVGDPSNVAPFTVTDSRLARYCERIV